MKIITLLKYALLCFLMAPVLSHAETPRSLSDSQIISLVNGVISPLVQNYVNKEKVNSALDVVIIDDANLRKELTRRFKPLEQCLKFEPESAVVFKGGRYTHKTSGRRAYVNNFKMIDQTNSECAVEWVRTSSSLGGASHTITLKRSNGVWIIANKKLEAQS